jgi:3-oxoacyl-[acyl-carrier protein] reductase
VKALRDEFGEIYGLVNNAGIGTEGLLATMHNTEIEALLRLNILSPIILTKYIVRQMMADGAGRIINMSSIIATTGYNGLSVYGATKAAASGFTRSLAREVGKLGITVNAIAPGFVDTELTESLSEDQRKRIATRSALRRLPHVDDVARMVEYLLGDGGNNITGSVLTIDAGNTA